MPQKRTGRVPQKTSAKQRAKNASKPVFGKAQQKQAKESLLDERSKRDVIGVALIIAAIALFVIAILPSDGVVTSVVSTALHYGLGIGVYLAPFMLLGLAVTFLVRFEREILPARVAIGLGMIFIALLCLVALFTPEAEQDPNRLFQAFSLVSRGGYVGAGLAWVCLRLFGLIVSVIIMVGLIVLALIIIGFSISSLIERLRDSDATHETEDDAPPVAQPMQPRIRRARNKEHDAPDAAIAQLPTRALTGKKKAANPINSAETIALDDSASDPARQLTRKLGSKSGNTKPKAKKKADTIARPKPQEGFELPPMSLLKTSPSRAKTKEGEHILQETGMLLQDTLADFGVDAQVVGWVPGPTVTLFKVDLPSGVRVSRVSSLEDDIALALAAPGVRIFAPIPGTNYVGIEVPNRVRESVLLGDVLGEAPPGPLQIAIGKDVEGECIVSDLATMPHLLIGGTTGSGKSVAINCMIMSILMRATPSEVRLIMIDPKRVEFTPYNGIPHLYVPVVTEAREAANALAWGVAEMEKRLKIFSKVGARNIGQYNAKVQNGLEIDDTPAEEMPYLVIIIDELADLMMNVGKEVEFSISRLAQLARAAGIHLIVATQRPSTNVVTGLIKANITNRIAFNVASGIDSRVILDSPGAENLIGLGDLLLSKPELAKPQRIQGCFVSEEEIAAVVELLKAQGEPDYHNDILTTNVMSLGDTAPDGSGGSTAAEDPLFWEAAEIVCSAGVGSTSNLQRRLSVGYSRAGRIMDMLEEKGIVGPQNGSKPREVLIDAMELESLKALELHDGDA